jgi:hypothetical protein
MTAMRTPTRLRKINAESIATAPAAASINQ